MTATAHTVHVLRMFDLYYARVYGFARRTIDPASAEDIAQEVFVKLLNLEGLEDREINASYLIKIADNLIKRRYRQIKRREQVANDRGRADLSSAECDTPSRQLENADGQRRIEKAIRDLPEPERDAVDLIVCRGLSYEAAARSLDVRVSTINNWKFRGIQRLKQDTPVARTAIPGRSVTHQRVG